MTASLRTSHLVGRHDPPVGAMEWGERLLFRSRHIYLLCAGAIPMAGRWPGALSRLGLFSLFGGVLFYTLVSLHRSPARPA